MSVKEHLEIEFLKSKTYTEINEIFNHLNNNITSLQKENDLLKGMVEHGLGYEDLANDTN